MDRFAYADHSDLLSQVASSDHKRDEVRRILSGKLSESELDARIADKWPSCCGACAQGRRLCPCPTSCQVSTEPDPPRPDSRAGDALRVIAGVLLAWAVVAGALLAMGVWP